MRRDHDVVMQKWRHRIENFIAKIKEYRAIAMGYDKTDTCCSAFRHLAAAMIDRKMNVGRPWASPSDSLDLGPRARRRAANARGG